MKKEGGISLVAKVLCGIIFLPFWHLQRLLPRRKDLWLFGSWFGQRYSDNSRAVYEYVLKNLEDVHPVWITHNNEVYERLKKEGKPVEMACSSKGRRTCLKAGVSFITTSPTELNAGYLNGSLMVWLWHGVGIKCAMADEYRFKWEKFSAFKKFKVRINRLLFPYEAAPRKDYVLNTSVFFNPSFCSMFEVGEDRLWNTGLPRNDALFSDVHETLALKMREKYPHARFVIYMPTHRLNARSGVPFNGFEFPDFHADEFLDFLEREDIVFFNKGHFYDREADIHLNGERFVNLTDNDYDNMYSFIKDMDILITDFSSIYCDFMLLGKPMILAPFDYDNFVARERSFEYDFDEQKAVKAYNWGELMDILRNRTYFAPPEDERAKFLSHIDGNNCERVVSNVLEVLGMKMQ